MAAENQVALSRLPRGPGNLSKATRRDVPPFLQKLYEMVSDPATDELIRWSDTGDSFLVLDRERVAHDVLPRWFKHNQFASFVRQLNMYGFHKIPNLQQGVLRSEMESETWNFEHPNFHRGQPDLLCLISRKKQASDKAANALGDAAADGAGLLDRVDATAGMGGVAALGVGGGGVNQGAMLDIHSIINGISVIKRHQTTISAELNELKASNQALWQEAIAARERHKKHQDTINRILKFLAGVFGNVAATGPSPGNTPPPGIVPRKRQRLMIEGSSKMAPSGAPVAAGEASGADQTLKDEVLQPASPVFETESDDGNASNRFATVDTPSIASPMMQFPPDAHFSTPATETPLFSPHVSHALAGQLFPSMSTESSSPTASAATPVPPSSQTPSVSAPTPASASVSEPSSSTTSTSPDQKSKQQQQPMDTDPYGGSHADAAEFFPSDPHSAKVDPVIQTLFGSPSHMQRFLASLSQQPSAFDASAAPHDLTALSAQDALYQQLAPAGAYVPQPDTFYPSVLPPGLPAPNHGDNTGAIEPLLQTSAELQKTYKDTTAITADVDALQASIDSLIENLGINPEALASMTAQQQQPASTLQQPQPQPSLQPSLHRNAKHDVHVIDDDPVLSHPHTDSQAHMSFPALDGTDMDPNAQTFDFDAFLNQFTTASDALSGEDAALPPHLDTMGLGMTDHGFANSGLATAGDHLAPAAYVDEVNSVSDAASPAATRVSIEEEREPVTPASGAPLVTAMGNDATQKKSRKRKSDATGAGSSPENAQSKYKKKR